MSRRLTFATQCEYERSRLRGLATPELRRRQDDEDAHPLTRVLAREIADGRRPFCDRCGARKASACVCR
jgi:hypothetical protein